MDDQVQSKIKPILIGDVMNEAYHLIHGMKLPIFWRMLVMSLLSAASGGLLALYLVINLQHGKEINPSHIAIISHVLTFICGFFIFYLSATAILLAVRHAVHLPLAGARAFSECWREITSLFILYCIIFIAGELISVVDTHLHITNDFFRITVFLALSVIFIMIFIPIFTFVIPLVVINKIPLQAALEESYKKAGEYWFEILICNLILWSISIMIAAPYFISLATRHALLALLFMLLFFILGIWILPMYYNLAAVLFKDIYGPSYPKNNQ